MKILIVVDHALGIDGPHRNVVGTLNALGARKDLQVQLVTGKIDQGEPYSRAANLKIDLDYNPHALAAFAKNISLIRSRSKSADVIYVPSGLKSCLYVNLAGLGLGKPLVVGPNVTHLPWRKADSPGNFEIKRLTDLWLEASVKRCDHVRAHVGLPLQPKVQNLPHAIDLKKFSPSKKDPATWKKYGIPESGLKVLYVGRDNIALKGVRQLLDAIEIASKNGLNGAQFIFVGRMSQLTAMRARGRSDIHLLGFQTGDDLAQIYAAADFSVVPSSWENFPFVVLEGLASGLPVIGSRTGGIPELIEHRHNGLLVDIVGADGLHTSGAPEILAKAITDLANDAALRSKLAQNARHTAETKFSESRLGDDLVRVFTSLLPGPGKRT